ncbi:MAG: serine protease, partial [Clostridia bacterium]|nr:serine protease [Clostridia bacterium]
MNNIIELKGNRFIQASRQGNGGGPSINSKQKVSIEHLLFLKNRLIKVRNFWMAENKPFEGVLVSVHYNKIVAKSNRISGLFKGANSNYAIVGAKFNTEKNKHIITYYLSNKDLENSIILLTSAEKILNEYFKDGVTKSIFDDMKKFNKIRYDLYSIVKTTFRQIIADISYIENFTIEMPSSQITQSIVTLFDVGMDTKQLLEKIGIDILGSRVLDN